MSLIVLSVLLLVFFSPSLVNCGDDRGVFRSVLLLSAGRRFDAVRAPVQTPVDPWESSKPAEERESSTSDSRVT